MAKSRKQSIFQPESGADAHGKKSGIIGRIPLKSKSERGAIDPVAAAQFGHVAHPGADPQPVEDQFDIQQSFASLFDPVKDLD